jgi:hypothetical protein
MRIGRDQADLVKAFAEARGIKIRAAQVHRQKQSPEWIDFVQRRASGKVATVPTDLPAMDFDSSLSEEELIEKTAFENWKRIASALAASPNDANCAAMARGEQLAAESYRKAKRAREAAQVAAGKLVPVSVVMELRKRFIQPLRSLLENMPAEVGPRANSFDSTFAIQVCEEWLRNKFWPKLEEATMAFAKYKQAQQPEQ